jgi:DNA-binding response OmpR family regulator
MLDLQNALKDRHNHAYPNLRGKRVLIVEDDPVIAVDYHFQLKDVGATAEGFKASNRDALTYLASHAVDAAIVDFLLCDGTGESIIAGLKSRSIPFIVVSGCTFRMHGEVDAAHVLSKPVAPGEIWRALSDVLH